MRKAIQLNSTESEAPHSYAHFFVAMGRFQDAERQGFRTLELDPLDASKREHIGWHYMRSRKPTKSATECERALEIDFSSKGPSLYLQQAYEDAGMFDKAIDAVERRATMLLWFRH